MAPIRVALIGLSTSAKVAWAAEAHLPYLLSLRGGSHYILVALLNSSVSAAEAAKKHYNLDHSVKTYGDPAALAADPDIDLVVCNTRVDVHYRTVEPSLRAGKAVFVEWPLTENLSRALDLTRNQEIPNSIIGLQGRVSPITLRLKEILATGAIGKVLSSEIRAFGNLLPADAFPENVAYFANRKVGGHQINIAFGHLIDYAHEVLGEFEDFESRMQIQRPIKKIIGADGQRTGTVEPDVPDFLAIHGRLGKSKANVVDGATLVATFRHGHPFKDMPGLTWTVNGERGELKVQAPGPYLMSDSYDGPISIQLHDHATDEVREMGWDWKDWQKELPIRARIIAEVYERYAKWVEHGKPEDVVDGDNWPRLHDAVVRMREFDKLYRQYDEGW
ncbi:oxidoreductase family protein [Lojkania enalia]|uniref:Oxidoreductase family protein n=1 Tax=Lojkania enalia TaxID=147567 RepID=A0A9P4N5T7_9PLEO|nr:oxidoreductase family protein [Didymosphaeria enalia]